MHKEETYAKSVRFPADIYAWIDSYGADGFSKNLIQILRRYKDEESNIKEEINRLQTRKSQCVKNAEDVYSKLAGLQRTRDRLDNVNRQIDYIIDDLKRFEKNS